MNPPLHSFIEFHDSRISAITRRGDEVQIEFAHAYLIEFEGEPFKEPGNGFSQRGRLLLTGMSGGWFPDLASLGDEETFDIWKGTLWVNGEEIRSVFRLPLDIQNAEIRLEIQLNMGETVEIECSGIRYEALNEPRFIEKFRA